MITSHRLKIKLQKPNICKYFIAIWFVLLCRPISIYYFVQDNIWNSIYTWSSRVIGIIAILLMIIYKEEKEKGIIWIFIITGSLLIATVVEKGTLRRWFTLFYPLIALCCLIVVQLRNVKKTELFINAVSNVFFILSFLNLMCIFYNIYMFGVDTYFIGLKNQIGYALNIGLLLMYMDAYIRKTKSKLYIYIVIYFVTVLKVASSASFVGACIILLYFTIPFFKKSFKKIDFRFLLIMYICLFVGVVFFSTQVLNWEPVKYFIENILGKNVTLTNRTVIWRKVISEILQKPVWGHGIQESSNLFYIHIDFLSRAAVDGTYSAHNQILQTLYEGGIVTITLVFGLLWSLGKKIKKCDNEYVSSICKLMLSVTLIMMLSESPGLDSLLVISAFTMIFVSKKEIWKER